MLKDLRINNIILINSVNISFEKGFNVLSGESGSGKSAVINALKLLAGDRGDASFVRRNAEKGIVEAIFDIEQMNSLVSFLNEKGIDHEPGQELLIRREIFSSGKSRAFINNQTAQLGLLRQLSASLFEIIGQHANQKLLTLEFHREALDLFGNLREHVVAFNQSWEEETQRRRELQNLVDTEAQRLREIEVCRMEIQELEDARLQNGEEEELFSEYSLLSNTDLLLQKAGEINRVLTGEKIGALPYLSRQKSTFEQLARLDPSLEEALKAYQNSMIELYEVSQTLKNYESRLELNPERAAFLNERLALIARLKKKYGPSTEAILDYLVSSQKNLELLEASDNRIDFLTNQLQNMEKNTQSLGKRLTEFRIEAAKTFEQAIIYHLRELNMSKAEFFVEISPQKRNRYGDDKIEFFLIPNVGERRIPLRECASGGELSRVMLALQTLLAGKDKTPVLIFDEIDANIGGETATVVGEKLKDIGARHQVICITHFPQVAKLANHHLQIFKTEIEGRTLAAVKALKDESRREELLRMLGGSEKYT